VLAHDANSARLLRDRAMPYAREWQVQEDIEQFPFPADALRRT
jgi:hypothetical protein